MRCLWASAATCAVLLWAAAAAAELYRCEALDGSTVFTDSRSKCPGAQEHRTAPRAVQRVEAQPVPSMQAAGHHANAYDAEAAEETRWRGKKAQAKLELESVIRHKTELMRFVSYCSRGGDLYREKENGLRTAVSCNGLKAKVANLESRQATLAEYLDSGLREECRRAGCLPGWLR